jgi:hypothetical protein
MPKYRQERVRSEAAGAGVNAGEGLSRVKKGKKGTASVVHEEPMDFRDQSRSSLVDFRRQLKTVRRANKIRSQEKNKKRKGPGVIDPKSFLRRITRDVIENFNQLLGAPAPNKEELSLEEKKWLSKFEKWKDKGYTPVKEAYSPDIRRSKDAFFGASLHLAQELLEKKMWFAAFEIIEGLTSDYLNDNEGKIPHEMGLKVIELNRIISRAWVVAHASEYAEFNLEAFQPFLGNNHLGKVRWSAQAIFELEKVGELHDLPPIRIIGYDCWEGAMEGYCSKTSNTIRIREGIKFILQREESNAIARDNSLSEPQLLYRLTILMRQLGIGQLFARHPHIAQFGKAAWSPVDDMVDSKKLRELIQEGLEQKISFRPTYYGDGMDAYGYSTTEKFCLDHGIIVKQDNGRNDWDCEYLLTEKGKELVSYLVRSIGTIKINYDGKREDPRDTMMREIFG